jgi:hypothetical protein
MNLLSEPKNVPVRKEWFLLEQAVCIRMEKQRQKNNSTPKEAQTHV